jgi:hypothetical protein
MLLLGLNITSPGDKLQPISIERFFQGIQDSKQTFKDQISQLRSIATMDINKYRDLKKKLPYVVCGMFHPLIRRKENFSAIQYFIIDMDHIVEHGKWASKKGMVLWPGSQAIIIPESSKMVSYMARGR